jgi:predicted ATPase
MINKLTLQNFKIHKLAKLNFGNLTLLTGYNGTGKSTLIQSILFLIQSCNNQIRTDGFINLGRLRNIFNDEIKKNELLKIIIDHTSGNFKWSIKFKNRLDYDYEFHKTPEQTDARSLFKSGFHYIKAGDTDRYDDIFRFLGKNKDKEIPIELRHPLHIEEKTLLGQVNAWMNEDFGFTSKINIGLSEVFTTVSLILDDEYSNIEYNIPNILPIVITLLSANQESLVLLENPESNLHPSSQSRLAELLAKSAQHGIQIIAKTHSDHIINGTLVQCKRFRTDGPGINRKNVKIYHFSRSEETNECVIEEVVIHENEKILHPPAGFFDQIREDYRELLR